MHKWHAGQGQSMHFPTYQTLNWFEATHMPAMQSTATSQSQIMVHVDLNLHDFEATKGILRAEGNRKLKIKLTSIDRLLQQSRKIVYLNESSM